MQAMQQSRPFYPETPDAVTNLNHNEFHKPYFVFLYSRLLKFARNHLLLKTSHFLGYLHTKNSQLKITLHNDPTLDVRLCHQICASSEVVLLASSHSPGFFTAVSVSFPISQPFETPQ